MNDIKALIIDDEPQLRKLIAINLEQQGIAVVSAATGREGVVMAASHQPDIILLDLGLPDRNGHEILTELQQWFANPVLILSARNTEEDIVKALDNGAADYIVKPFRTGELMARLRTALRQKRNAGSEPIIVLGDLTIDLASRQVTRDGNEVHLTVTEFKLLAIMASNEGRVVTHRFLLNEVWGIAYQTETQYLRVFVAQLRKKLEKDPNRPAHLLTENGIGYRLI
jgi:two-component system, OmpR family, KDP operon response regulator KdpE